jgi:hypothetical protein
VQLEPEPVAVGKEAQVEIGHVAAAPAGRAQIGKALAPDLVRLQAVQGAAQALRIPVSGPRRALELREGVGVRLEQAAHRVEAAGYQDPQLGVDVGADETEAKDEVLFGEDVLVVLREDDSLVPLAVRHGCGAILDASTSFERSR